MDIGLFLYIILDEESCIPFYDSEHILVLCTNDGTVKGPLTSAYNCFSKTVGRATVPEKFFFRLTIHTTVL